jgi:outer membrane immunogenic protein
MRTKIVSLLAVAFSLGVVQAASAADMPTKAPIVSAPSVVAYNWTGFYVGIDGGWGWGEHDRLATTGFANSYNSEGGLIGGHAGYNWQINQFVLGVEGDAHWADIKGDDGGVGGTVDQTTTRFLGSIRGRAGFAWNQFLVFGTGGWGFADLNHNNPGGVPADNSFTRNGATAGGGVQWAFNQNWSVGAEYRHYWLGTYSAAPTGLTAFQVSNRLDTVTARISYKFGP